LQFEAEARAGITDYYSEQGNPNPKDMEYACISQGMKKKHS
jgi:hypothetical protein